MSDIFISYSRKDIAFARLLHAALKGNGFETWIDWQDIPPSADWLAEVYEAIEQADSFVFIISETSVESEVCGLEISHAAEHNKRLIPIVIGDILAERVPKSLAVLNWIFFEDAGDAFASAVEDLLMAITIDQAWVKAHTDTINDVAFSPDGASVATVSVDQTIRLWDAETLVQIGDPFATQGANVLNVAYHPQDGMFATACADGVVRLWLPGAKASIIEDASGHSDAVWDVDITSSGDTLAASSADGAIRLWNVAEAPELVRTLHGDIGQIYSLHFSPDDSMLAAGGQFGVRIWDWRVGKQIHTFTESHTQPVVGLAFNLDGSLLATGSMDSMIVLWDLITATQIDDPLEGHHATVNDLAFSPDGHLLASVGCGFAQEEFCAGGELIVWDLAKTPVGSKTIPIHGHNVYALAFSPDGETIATGSMDETIRLWDVVTGEQVGDPILGHEGGVTSLAFSPDGRVLASGGLVRLIWALGPGEQPGIQPGRGRVGFRQP